ncbi:integrin alpha [Streptomyces sp. NPDC088762]|uniref:integrin alpha n=1 Tax=Streptomyces sp. NPDC088762 TaxID=3365891 RepID=UPI00380BB7D5
MAAALALTTGPLPLSTPAAAAVALAAGCSGAEADFNGDGIRDTAIADPEATAAGMSKAGVVHIVYGGGKGVLELTQEVTKAGASESGDRFGYSLAVYDADLDGCSDLAVGAPYEDIGTKADAGRVIVVYGSPAGLGAGKEAVDYTQGTGLLANIPAETDDWTGYSLAAGKSSTGVPFLAFGAPGEDVGTITDAGDFFYISGSTTVTAVLVTQDSTTAGAVPDAAEPYDRFGTAITATPTHLVVSSPGEAQGAIPDAGAVTIFSHALTSGSPKPLSVVTQDTPNMYGSCENGDVFGTSITAVPYRAAGATSTTESLLAVGVPGEDLDTTVDAGAVQVLKLDAAGAYTDLGWIHQNVANVGGESEPGDRFGQRVAAFNTEPTATSTAANVRLAVGVPGEDSVSGLADRGMVHMFGMVGPPGDSDKLLEPGSEIQTPSAAHLYAGMSIGGGSAGLYVGMPYGPAGGRAVYLFPWTISGSGGTPIETFKPGEGGLPADAPTFGTVAR